MMKTTVLTCALALLTACGQPTDAVHNLSVDEARRAQINAQAFFDAEHPAGTDAAGNLVKKRGSFSACRPQDSNSNGLVTCTGMLPNMSGTFQQATRYCGYATGAQAVLGCSDKDQK